MITEIYTDKKLIDIKRNQNDGQSKSFDGDGLVNLFLYTFNVFLYGRREKVLDRLSENINTISDGLDTDEMVEEFNTKMRKEYDEAQEMIKKEEENM